jgi:hypothetical protein
MGLFTSSSSATPPGAGDDRENPLGDDPHRLPAMTNARVATDPKSVSFLLRQFETPGVHPTSARVGPQLLQRQTPSLSLRDAWRFGAFVASKGSSASSQQSIHNSSHTATEVTIDVLSHHLRGPRKKSWGIEMTLITSILRNAGNHSYLADIVGDMLFSQTTD